MRPLSHNEIKLTVKNGVRYLHPYWDCFTGFAKQRWVGKKIFEVFKNEFIGYHPLYSIAAIRKGRLFVNGIQMTNPDYRVRTSDKFVHLVHRHENEIPDIPIKFIAETDDFLVIDKPPGLPVHPCGNYRLNSVKCLLENEYGREKQNLRPLYRLDRQTTGVLMFAKNHEADLKFKKEMRRRTLSKTYLAKVDGIFPKATGIRRIDSNGQDALSKFWLVYANNEENTSIVRCQIETGRTHQIRVHLQYLGFPICNDTIYNDFSWGPLKGKGCDYGGKSIEQLNKDVTKQHDKKSWICVSDPDYAQRLKEIGEDEMCEHDDLELSKIKFDALPNYDPLCWNCATYQKFPFTKNHWFMPLHCWRYIGDGWSFEAPLPEWAIQHSDLFKNNINSTIEKNVTEVKDF